MSTAKTTGAQPTPPSGTSTPKSREHNQGQQNREYTPAQKAAVDRVRKCKHHAYYEILDIKVEATEGEVKKAYRKLALLMHPDKNGAPGADEAFKMVSRAFQVLSDTQKRSHFDKFGGDPDSRSFPGAGGGGGGGFPGFSGGAPRGARFEDEISPEDLFNMFFGGNAFGGPMGGFGGGGGGTFFDLGGGPAIRIHHFGGGRPQRRRARGPNDPEPQQEPRTTAQIITQLLPLIILVVFPILSSIFSALGGSSSSDMNRGPNVYFTYKPPYTEKRVTKGLGSDIPYYVNPADIEGMDKAKLTRLDKSAENKYVRLLQTRCNLEWEQQEKLYQESQGWLFVDEEKAEKARRMPKPACQELGNLGLTRNY